MSCCDGTSILIKNTLQGIPAVVTVKTIQLSEGTLKTTNNTSGADLTPGTVLPLGQDTGWYAFSGDGTKGAASASITLQIQWLQKTETVVMTYDLEPRNWSGDPPCGASYSVSSESSGNCFSLDSSGPNYGSNPDGAPTLLYILSVNQLSGCTQPPGPSVSGWTASAPQGGIWQPGNTVRYGVEWTGANGVGYPYSDTVYWGPAVTISNGAYPTVTGIPTDPTNAGYDRWLMRQVNGAGETYLHDFGTDNTITSYTDTQD